MLSGKTPPVNHQFRLSQRGRADFVMLDHTVSTDNRFETKETIRQDSLCPGVFMLTVEMRNCRGGDYQFEVSNTQLNISFCTAGRSRIRFKSGVRCPDDILHSHTTCTVGCLQEARGAWTPLTDSCRMVNFSVSPEGFNRLWQDFSETLPRELSPLAGGQRPLPFFVGLPVTPYMQMVVNALVHPPVSGPGKKLLRECKMLELMVLLLSQLAGGECKRNKNIPLSADDMERIYAVRDILEQRMDAPPGLSQLSRMTGLNEFKLKRGFRQEFDTTPYGYLRTVRLNTAKQYLEKGDMNVYEACLAVGYSSLSNFIALFKKEFGITPGKVLQCALRVRSGVAGPSL